MQSVFLILIAVAVLMVAVAVVLMIKKKGATDTHSELRHMLSRVETELAELRCQQTDRMSAEQKRDLQIKIQEVATDGIRVLERALREGVISQESYQKLRGKLTDLSRGATGPLKRRPPTNAG
ncbi:MAG: hypothetical protein JO317_02650 [Verrucomicrobiae bacterium]|nr:hypothetical protein [Verrucomicrobiae bacterium]